MPPPAMLVGCARKPMQGVGHQACLLQLLVYSCEETPQQRQLREVSLFGVNESMMVELRHGGRSRKLRAHISDCTQEAERSPQALKTCPQSHTFSNKVTPPKLSQTVPPIGDQIIQLGASQLKPSHSFLKKAALYR